MLTRRPRHAPCGSRRAHGHKLARGYEPEKTYSVHWMANYLQRERAQVARDIEALGEYTPFRKGEVPETE